MSSDRSPNFILFVTDQQRADLLGCMGHPALRTPHIDSIAHGGVIMQKFYVASPICMPNRASLMTACYPSVHGVRGNGIPLGQEHVSFVELLRDAGYQTALVGKSHLQNFSGRPALLDPHAPRPGYHVPAGELGQSRRTRYDGAAYAQEAPNRSWDDPATRVDTPFYGFDAVDLCIGHGDQVLGNYVAWARERGLDLAAATGPGNALTDERPCPQAWRTAVPAELYPSAYIADRASAAIGRFAQDGRPFFLMVSFPDPHHPFTPPGRYWDMYRAEDMPVPDVYKHPQWLAPPHVQALFDARRQGKAQLNGYSAFAVDEREAAQAHALTCGMMSCIDDAVGQVLQALRASGAERDTVLAYTSDHGDFLGDHGLLLKGPAHYQSLVRVPFLWRDPRRQGVDTLRSDELASTLDIGTTILDRARIEPAHGMQGRSLLGALDGGAGPRQAVFIEEEQQRVCFGFDAPPRAHTVVTRDRRLSVYRGVDWGELYDLAADPGEMDNRWSDDASLPAKADMLAVLAREQLDAADAFPFPTGQS